MSKRPPHDRADQPGVAGAHHAARVAHAGAERGEDAADAALAGADPLRAEHDADDHGAEDRGHDGDRERAAAGQQPEREAGAADDQRAHVDAVEQHEEGGHARGDGGALHARAAHRPGGQRDAAGAGAGQQPRRGVAGERDLDARAQADAAAVVEPDGAEEDRVAEEGERLEHEGEQQPAAVAVLEPVAARRAGPRSRGRCSTSEPTSSAAPATMTSARRTEIAPSGATSEGVDTVRTAMDRSLSGRTVHRTGGTPSHGCGCPHCDGVRRRGRRWSGRFALVSGSPARRAALADA